MKKILGIAAAAILAAASATAGVLDGMELSGKLNIGYATGASYFDTDYGSGYGECSGFEIYPALVILPEATKFEDKPFDVSFELSLDMVFGSSDYYDGYKSTIITPGVSALFNWHFEESDSDFLQKLTPYAGLQIGVPIQKTTFSIDDEIVYDDYPTKWHLESTDYSGTKIGLGMGFTAGVRYAFTEKIEADIETGYNFLSFHDFFLRAGALYRFK